MAIGIPDQLDGAGLVLSSHVSESSAPLEQDYGHIGYKGREPIQVLSLSHYYRGARHQMIETYPATRIRRTALRTSVSMGHVSASHDPIWTDPEIVQRDKVVLSSRWPTSRQAFYAVCLAVHVCDYGFAATIADKSV